jgi:hypothetical protein
VLYGPFFDLAPRKDPWPAAIMNEYGKLATAAARGGWHVHQHVINNNAVTDLLDTLEKVNNTRRIDSLRWTMGHVYDISQDNIARAKALGMTLGVHGAAAPTCRFEESPTAASCSAWAPTPRSSRTTRRSSRWAGSSAGSTSAATACSTRR